MAEYTDDGLSGARLDRPGLDALRDAAEAGHIESMWCLSADRLARMYAYQVIVLDELARHGVSVSFLDTPKIEDDPQARLLTQVQGVIAEYERAKIAERYRRGKLWRSRAGEVIAWKPSYGYRRIPRVGERRAHLEVFEHEAAVVRRIFDDYVHKDLSMRQIAKGLNYDGISSPSGRAVWGVSTIARILRNEAYIGRVYANRTEAVLDRRLAGKTRQVPRPRDQWIAIAVPGALDEELFEAAQRVSRDNSQWSPRRAESGYWLLRGLVKCGHCAMSVSCHKMRGRNGTFHRYYYCRNHDPLRAGGEHRRCPGRNIRADELDAFVFEQARDALLRPDVLLSGEHAVSARREPAADELLQAQLAKLQRKIDAVAGERRRLADLYQAAFIEREELLRRGNELQNREQHLQGQRDALIAQRTELAHQNTLRERIAGFSAQVGAAADDIDFEQRQKLLRLVVEHVFVRGWRVEIQLRIPLDEPPTPPDRGMSSKDCLRSLGNCLWRAMYARHPSLARPRLMTVVSVLAPFTRRMCARSSCPALSLSTKLSCVSFSTAWVRFFRSHRMVLSFCLRALMRRWLRFQYRMLFGPVRWQMSPTARSLPLILSIRTSVTVSVARFVPDHSPSSPWPASPLAGALSSPAGVLSAWAQVFLLVRRSLVSPALSPSASPSRTYW